MKRKEPIFLRLARLAAFSLAAFASLAGAQEVPESVKTALKEADAEIAKIIAIPDAQRTFDNTIGALDDMSVRLNDKTVWVSFMQNVATDASVREESRVADEAISNWSVEMGKREDLYKAVKAYADTHPKLEGEQARLLEFTMRDYHLAGMDLPPADREKLKALEIEENKLSLEFEKNIADDETSVPFMKDELKGVPEDVLKKQVFSNGAYLFGTDAPSYDGVMSNATNATTRQKFWLEYKRRGGSKNVQILEKLIKNRAEQAKLLGFATAADMIAYTRMAKNAATIAKFYKDLQPIVRKKAQKDMDEFVALKRKETHDPTAVLYPWDYTYYKNQLQKQKYSVDDSKVAEYFPMDRVIDGLFTVTQSLYGLKYEDVTSKAAELKLPIWQPDVKLYEVKDTATNEVLGHFYLDPFPREGKYTHFATFGLISHKVWSDGTVDKPVEAVVCNFTKPGADKPSLMLHDEVVTFFHEFGHALHGILDKAHYNRFTNVERDFVEAPSQMFENWVWDPAVLKTFAKHYKTGEPLPDSLLKGMLAARYLGSGLEAEHQFYYGMVDQAYHTAPSGEVDTTKVALDMYPQVELYPRIPGTYYQASFDHLVGYEAAYYGYQWSLVYAQDMFQRFKEQGLLNPKAGAYYREKILARGGTMDAMDMVKDYLGREPNLAAFLENLGLDPKGK